MENYFDFQTLRDLMKGKHFDTFYLKNIVGQNGLTSQMFLFKETESNYLHSINVLKKKMNYKRVLDTKYKNSNEQLIVLKDFHVADVSLLKENEGFSLKFCCTHYSGLERTPVRFEFKLMHLFDGLYYNCSNMRKENILLNYFNRGYDVYEFLSLKKDRVFNKEELLIGNDKFGTPLYTNDKVFHLKEKVSGVIKYHFVYKEYLIVTDNHQTYKLNDIRENIVVFERKDKARKNNQHFSNIVSIFHYLVGENEQSIDYLRDLLDFLDDNRLSEEIYAFIDRKIISGEIVMECVDDFNVKVTYKS